MRQRDSFKAFCKVYYQLKDTLDENQELLDSLRDHESISCDDAYAELEQLLENERDKIIKISCDGFESLCGSKQQALIEKIRQMAQVQEDINNRLLKIEEGDDSFEEVSNDSLYKKLNKSDTVCSEEDTKKDSYNLDQDSNIEKANTSMKTISTRSSIRVCYDKLPETFSNLKRHKKGRLSSNN